MTTGAPELRDGRTRPRRWPWVAVGAAGTLVVVAVLAVVLGLLPANAPGPLGPLLPTDAAAARPLLASGFSHSCAVDSDGRLSCWGSNSEGQLGLGVRTPFSDEPVEPVGLGSVSSVSAGSSHTCAVTVAGGVRCWGNNSGGALGDGMTGASTVPVDVVGLGSGVAAVAAGGGHTCAVTDAGGVSCWGNNGSGQLGHGAAPVYDDTGRVTSGIQQSPVPVAVSGLESGVVALSAGGSHTCAVTDAGGVKCWGNNGSGQLGHAPAPVYDDTGTLVSGVEQSAVPVAVSGLESGVVALSAGGSHTCALTDAGAVKCWGWNSLGQLGNAALPVYGETGTAVGGTESSATPVDVVGLGSDVASVASEEDGTCAVTDRGGVWCWGGNQGQFGPGTDPVYDDSGSLASGTERSDVPVEIPGLAGSGLKAREVTVGMSHACVRSTGGDVVCWGRNESGQLGNPTAPRQGATAPVPLRRTPRVESTPRHVLLNLIVIDSGLDMATDVARDERVATSVTAGRLQAQDPALVDAVRAGVREATFGRVEPRVEVVVGEQLLKSTEACLDFDANVERVEGLASPYRKEGAINVAVVRAPFCRGADHTPVGGYDNPIAMPVVGWVSLVSVTELVHTTLHEYGHDANLLHAGLAMCDDPVALKGCITDEVGDSGSVMSYARSSDAFTAPELDVLGLLGPEERVGPGVVASGEYHLVDVREEGTKLLQLSRESGNSSPLTLSVSHSNGEIQVRFSKWWIGPSSYGTEQSQASLALVHRQPPNPGDVLVRLGDDTVTYVGPDADGNSVVRVSRPGDPTPTPDPSPAEPSPSTSR